MSIYFLPAMQAYVTTTLVYHPDGWCYDVIELIDNGQLVMRIVDGATAYITEDEKFLKATLLSSMAEHKEAVEAFLRAICGGYEPYLGNLAVGDGVWVDTRDVRDWEDFVSDLEEF